MTQPFGVPEEFFKGFIRAGSEGWQGLVPNADGGSQVAVLYLGYLRQQGELWARALTGASGQPVEPVITPARGDRRFGAAEWREHPAYSHCQQSYLLASQLLEGMVEAAELDEPTRQRVRFYTRQFIDLMSPANFPASNPEVTQLAYETMGDSLRRGFENLLGDIRKGSLTITDEGAFEVGRNVAASEGAVVFENELIQLIQYAPLTGQVAARPLLIVPPCINKFYILDLQPANSFVRFAVEQGHTVFLVSWRNPDASCAHFTWEDYLQLGIMEAVRAGLEISAADRLNALGWCVGGTILSSALAVMRARGEESVASLTLLTTMLDFTDPGELGIFIDEANVAQREEKLGQGGLYPGSELSFVFQSLRANELIWPNVINNYLKGKSPEAFDLLYWNSDTTNLSGPMYAWYLRNMYLENNLRHPGRLSLCGMPVDLGAIDMPAYVLATQEDHIVPWKSAYRTTGLLGGDCCFVLGASGHIAGVINPAAKNRRSYWIDGEAGSEAGQWQASASEVAGSWWTHWSRWLAAQAGKAKPVPARQKLGNAKYPVIEAAPGRYVRKKAQAS